MATLLDSAWKDLFDKYKILDAIKENGNYIISAKQIKEFREPRLMTKFDHSENLPELFKKHKLSILPISRSDFMISNHQMFSELVEIENNIERVKFPEHIQSIIPDEINSEAIALNCSYLTGMLEDFLEDQDIYPTVNGRMSSKKFKFEVLNTKTNSFDDVTVENSQIEIDGAFEGVNYLSLIEAKREICPDFLIRQLYYPYRLWASKVSKKIKLIYFVHSNGIFSFFEYKFVNENNYNSLKLIKQKNYSLEDVTITTKNIQDILTSVKIVGEPEVPFPQADTFRRIINLCELLGNNEVTLDDITYEYKFEPRQSSYYSNACRYLDLIEKYIDETKQIKYRLTKVGKSILSKHYVDRQLAIVKQILSHKIFNNVLRMTFDNGCVPDKYKIADEMEKCNLYNIGKRDTFERRAQTIQAWISWIIGLIQE